MPLPLDPPATRNPVGSHVRVGSGLVSGALGLADQIEAETIQVFIGNPRGWALSHGDAVIDAEFAEICARDSRRVFVHTPYLVNLGSPVPSTYAKSIASVAHNLIRGRRIGAEGVVVHTGSCVTEGAYDNALRQLREGLLPMLDDLGEGPDLLLEPTAGQGRSLCAGVDDLEPYLEALDHHPRVGICLDTCHVFAAGAPLDEPGGTKRTLDRLAQIAPGRLRLVHANDSMDPRGSLRDRHQQIGQGHIGTDAFTELMMHPSTAGVPLIAETPGSGEPSGPCLPLLKKLRAS